MTKSIIIVINIIIFVIAAKLRFKNFQDFIKCFGAFLGRAGQRDLDVVLDKELTQASWRFLKFALIIGGIIIIEIAVVFLVVR